MITHYWVYNTLTSAGVGITTYNGDAPLYEEIYKPPNRDIIKIKNNDVVNFPHLYKLDQGVIIKKAQLQFSASTLQFHANEIDTSFLEILPHTNIIVHINNQPIQFTENDPELILTSDVPKQFKIELRNHPDYYAESIIIEAI